MAKRRSKIPKPELQLKLVFVFLCVALACVLLQFNLLNSAIADVATKIPGEGLIISQKISEVLKKHLFIGVALLVPLTVSVGVLVTFRIAGPVYRFEEYLKKIADGGDPGPLSIRKGDELGDLCHAINAAVATLREQRDAMHTDHAPEEVLQGADSDA
ncbi:MAG: hypothetical protein AAF581_01640 [Planctomycetota bacterium]